MRVSIVRVAGWAKRCAGFALVFALAGFCYALASSFPSDSDVPAHAATQARAIGTNIPLRFTNPLVMAAAGSVALNPATGMPPNPAEYDLGDAALGSMITRYVTAEGGLRPYRFTSTGPNSLSNLVVNTTPTPVLTLSIAGVVSGFTPGTVPPTYRTFLGTPGLRFPVTVTDALGTKVNSVTANFNLFLVAANSRFRFATDTIPDGFLGSNYTAKFDVINGRGPIKVTALSVTNTGTGAATKLSDLGLFLAADGTLHGKPLMIGTFNILARAVDADGVIARNRRNANVTDQTYTLVVNDNSVTSSDAFTTSCVVKGDLKGFGKDSLKYKGVVNMFGSDELTLTGTTFTFALGGLTFSGRLDKSGRYSTKLVDKSTFSFSISARTGAVNVSINKSRFVDSLELTGLTAGTLRRPLTIMLGQAIVSTEVLDFESDVDGSKYALNYQIGRHGTSASGGFQLTKVSGKDDNQQASLAGDQWRVNFLAQPRKGVVNSAGAGESFDSISAVTVRVGTNFAQTVRGGAVSAGKKIAFKSGELIKSFSLDPKTGKGSMQSRTLPAVQTGIPLAKNALQFSNVFFPMGVDLARSTGAFTGEHARKIFNLGTMYADTPPKPLTSGIPSTPAK